MDAKPEGAEEGGGANTAGAVGSTESMLSTGAYLKVTYDPVDVPYGRYPYRLAKWLHQSVYKTPGRLLDLGCGRGEYLDAFTRLGYEVSGVDISPSAPEFSPNFAVEVVNLEQERLPFPDGSFDFVFSKSVIEHMRYPECLFSKALAVLRPAGKAVLMTPSWEHTYWGPFYIDHTHVTPFTAMSLRKALAIAGFDAISVAYFHQLPLLWRWPFLRPLVFLLSMLPLPYRPLRKASWPDSLNKLIRFSKELMLLAVGRKPEALKTRDQA